jgi:uracil-DNA glycosylase
MDYHLNLSAKTTLREAVKTWESHGTGKFILPHPSPRNNICLAQNPWFENEVLPPLQQRIQALYGAKLTSKK